MYKMLSKELANIDNVDQLEPEIIDMLMNTFVTASVEKLKITQGFTEEEGLLFTKDIINKLIDNMLKRYADA
tara:strand:- start:2505 stop:2720 length:216 start_codon:yes stop_codon:yes gene_type:complete